MLPDTQKRFITTLFLGTALSISSVKIVAMVVRDLGFLRRTVGQVIVSAAIIDDTIGWIIISVTLGRSTARSISLRLTKLSSAEPYFQASASLLAVVSIFLIRQHHDLVRVAVPSSAAAARQAEWQHSGRLQSGRQRMITIRCG
jgi:Kef-type K+ transport system membrane component KefB